MERKIDNAFYNELQDKWYTAYDHPVALLRAENASRLPWVLQEIGKRFPKKSCSILDIGCGAGFLSNALAEKKHKVVGIDLSETSLQVAKRHDKTRSVRYVPMSAEHLTFPEASFDVVAAMDLLEHVEKPAAVIGEAARMLKPGGLFFFHTFNRSWMSWLFAQKGLEWFVANTPKNLHIYRLFIKPSELKRMCDANGLETRLVKGLAPCLTAPFWKMLLTRKIPPNFRFKITNSLKGGYLGFAVKANTSK